MLNRSILTAGLCLLAGAAGAASPRTETAVLAGGCYWGMEAVFERVRGVTDVVSGFTNGAESVRVSYDPARISYAQLLKVYFTVAHDPTEVNRQGPDVGKQYRSAIFPQNAAQWKAARFFIGRLQAAHAYPRPIATKIEEGRFSPVPDDQQDFAAKHPDHPYIVVNDRPKIAALRQRFPDLWRG
jgi:peptide-methionine (S)-S-oxide reductase